MGGGSNSSMPPPSAEEVELQKAQLELLQQNRAETDAFKPILMEQFGLRQKSSIKGTPEYDRSQELQSDIASLKNSLDTGKRANGYAMDEADTIDYTRRMKLMQQELYKVDSAVDYTDEQRGINAQQRTLQKSQTEVSLLQAQKLKLALEGNAPVSQGTIQRKAQEFQAFKEQAARNGNPIFGDTPEEAFSTSTSGTQALKGFNDNWKLVEDAERRGEVAQGFGNLATGVQSGGMAQSVLRGGVPDLGTGRQLPMYTQAMQPYQFQRQGQFQASMANAQADATREAGMMSMVGSIAGVGAGLAIRSSKKFKKDIKEEGGKAISSLRKTKMYTFRYKEEDDDAKPHIGMIAERAPKEIITKDGQHLDVGDYLGLLASSVKSIDKELSRLKGKKKEAANA